MRLSFRPARIARESERSKRQPTTSTPPTAGRRSRRAARWSANVTLLPPNRPSGAPDHHVWMGIEHQEGMRAAAGRDALAALAAVAHRIQVQRAQASANRPQRGQALAAEHRWLPRAGAVAQVVDRGAVEDEVAQLRIHLPALVARQEQHLLAGGDEPGGEQGLAELFRLDGIDVRLKRSRALDLDADVAHARQAPVTGTPAFAAENRSPSPHSSTPWRMMNTVSRGRPLALIGW